MPTGFRVGLLADGPLHGVGLRTLEVELAYSSDIDAALPEQTETVQLQGVTAGEETPLVFGNDDYEYGWVNQVTCLDSTG